MPITYDKKFLKWYGNLDNRKIKKTAVFYALLNSFYYPFIFLFVYLVNGKQVFKWYNFFLSVIIFICVFILFYFLKIREIKSQKKLYDESIAYWKEHDPSYIDGIIDKT